MIKFTFRKEKLIHTPQVFLFKDFTNILDNDKSQSRLKSNRMFLYVFYMCDLTGDNPVRDDGDSKPANALFRAFGNHDKIKLTQVDKALLVKAMDTYIKYNETAEERLLTTFDLKSVAIRETLNEKTPEACENDIDGVVTFVSNSKIITSALTDLNDIKTKRELIVSSIRREALSSKVRGSRKLSPLSKGDILLHKDSDAVFENETLISEDNVEAVKQRSLSRLDQLTLERAADRRKIVTESKEEEH